MIKIINQVVTVFNRHKPSLILKTLTSLIPASIIYYLSYSMPAILNLGLLAQFTLPAIAILATAYSGYNYLSAAFINFKSFFKNILMAIKHKRASSIELPSFDMSVLVSLSMISSIGYGLFLGVASPLIIYTAPLFTLAALNFSMYCKNLINNKLDKASSKKLKKLESVLPYAKAGTIQKNDIVTIKPNHTIPVDGFLLSSNADIKDATIRTGEANKTFKVTQNSPIYAGTINSSSKSIRIKASCHGLDSAHFKTLNSMRNNIHKSNRAKAIDSVARYFGPSVLLATVSTLIFWGLKINFGYGFTVALDVLFAACPCALGIASTIPYSLLKNNLFNHGISVHNDSIVENLSKADTLVFDKTGTLTKLKLAEIHPLSSIDDMPTSELSSCIVKLQQLRLKHDDNKRASDPFAKEIISHYSHFYFADKHTKDEPLEIITDKSHGIAAKATNFSIFMGNKGFLVSKGFKQEDFPSELSTNNNTVVYTGIISDKKSSLPKLVSAIEFKQQLQSKANTTIERLRANGYDIHLLTGDNSLATKKVTSRLNITQYQANCTPEQKAEYIKNLISKGKNVIMVGDGYNDFLPAKAANIGSIAVGRDSIMSGFFDITIEKLNCLPLLKPSFQATNKNQTQVFTISILYNILTMILAAILFPLGGAISMTACFGTCMAFSSLFATAWSCLLLAKLKTIMPKQKTGKIQQDLVVDLDHASQTTELSNSKLINYTLDSLVFPSGEFLYYLSLDVYGMCGNCAKSFDAKIELLKKEIPIIDYHPTNEDNTYTLKILLNTSEPKQVLEKLQTLFSDKKILKQPSATIIAKGISKNKTMPIPVTTIRKQIDQPTAPNISEINQSPSALDKKTAVNHPAI